MQPKLETAVLLGSWVQLHSVGLLLSQSAQYKYSARPMKSVGLWVGRAQGSLPTTPPPR